MRDFSSNFSDVNLGRIAQLVRAPPLHGGGRGFESYFAHELMYSVYVLHSLKNGKQYIGFTSKPIDTRLSWHKWGLTAWTKQNGPFNLVYQEQFEDKTHAMSREKYFKTGQGRRTLKILINSVNSSASAKELGGPATICGGG